MSPEQMIAAYERILALMNLMHRAAEGREWERLVALEQQCKQVAQSLAEHDRGIPLGETLRQRKLALLRQILAVDAAIRDITEPWLRDLQGLLATSSRKRQLVATYGAMGRR